MCLCVFDSSADKKGSVEFVRDFVCCANFTRCFPKMTECPWKKMWRMQFIYKSSKAEKSAEKECANGRNPFLHSCVGFHPWQKSCNEGPSQINGHPFELYTFCVPRMVVECWVERVTVNRCNASDIITPFYTMIIMIMESLPFRTISLYLSSLFFHICNVTHSLIRPQIKIKGFHSIYFDAVGRNTVSMAFCWARVLGYAGHLNISASNFRVLHFIPTTTPNVIISV